MFKIENITHEEKGHTLHHNNVFSMCGKWVVFDERNDDNKIGETGRIGIIHVDTREERSIYLTRGQTAFGPGVGAASFHPNKNKVIFIHGLEDADQNKPYDITRRTGVIVDIHRPYVGICADGRDTNAPYVAGTLRGGTHSHMWSGDGRMISFTYNDAWIEPDVRTVGVMIPVDRTLSVDDLPGNNDGTYYAAIVSDVTAIPKCDSDEMNKAFDECWVGIGGYINTKGEKVRYAISFQGNIKATDCRTITEIFVVDIDEQIILSDNAAVGLVGQRPRVPRGVKQKRLSYSERGLSDLRHWLRSSRDGAYIFALAKDEKDRNQVVRCSINGGTLEYMTDFDFSISSPINLNNASTQVTFVADNQVYIWDLHNRKCIQVTDNSPSDLPLIGVPSFAPDDASLVFNQYVKSIKGDFVHIKRATLRD